MSAKQGQKERKMYVPEKFCDLMQKSVSDALTSTRLFLYNMP